MWSVMEEHTDLVGVPTRSQGLICLHRAQLFERASEASGEARPIGHISAAGVATSENSCLSFFNPFRLVRVPGYD